jgi:PAS domain S-box-containing protein
MNWKDIRTKMILPRQLSHLQFYALTVFSVGVTAGIGLLLQYYGFRDAGGPLLLFAVAVTSWYGGAGPSIFAIILASGCSNYFFIRPIRSLNIDANEIPFFIIFVGLASLIALMGTIRRRDEADLRQTRDNLRIEVDQRSSLLDLTHDSIMVVDMDFEITYWNHGAEEFYGWNRQEALGKRSFELLHTGFPKPLEQIRAELLQVDRWEGELKHEKKNGVVAIVVSRWSLRRDKTGRPVAILETSNDITPRKRWEEEMEALNRTLDQRSTALEASNKELEAFAYSISHDLRAPLRHLGGYAELLRKSAAGILNEKNARYLMMISEAAKKMSMLIDDLLAFSRVSRAEVRISSVKIGQIVQETIDEVRQDVGERNIAWKIQQLPNWQADGSMLRLALLNLIANAIKFTRPRAQAEIEIGCMPSNDNQIVLFVRDNGVGFDMKYYNKLFGVFQRLHSQETFEGTGIGLATVQRIVHRHGGEIWAEGAVDAGATFYFSLGKIKE